MVSAEEIKNALVGVKDTMFKVYSGEQLTDLERTYLFQFYLVMLGHFNTEGMDKQPPKKEKGMRVEVDSSLISAIWYNEDAFVLYIEFNTGNVYAYHDVPVRYYHYLKEAGSKGRWYNENIKGRFKSEKVK